MRAQLLDYPEERYHRYYYKLRVEAMGTDEDSLAPTQPFTLRLSASLPMVAEPYDWVECGVTFSAFDTSGLYSPSTPGFLTESRQADTCPSLRGFGWRKIPCCLPGRSLPDSALRWAEPWTSSFPAGKPDSSGL